MTKYATLLIAAYGLLAIETSLQTDTGLVSPCGSFVWMLLPWLGTMPSRSASIVAAAAYGLMMDAVSSHPPGLMIAVSIVAVCMLQRVLSPKALESSTRIFLTSLLCSCLMAMLVATVSMLTSSSPVNPLTLTASIGFSSVIAASFTTFVTTVVRSCGTVFILHQP